MAAPSGNSFWKKRNKHGREKLFASPKLLMEAVEEYLTYVDDSPWMNKEAIKGGEFAGQIISIPTARPYTLTGLYLYLGCNKHYFNDFKKNCSQDFSEVITRAEEIILTQQVEGAMVGAFNANLTARLNGISEKTEVDNQVTMVKPLIIDWGDDGPAA
ncbi:hypothetical protein A0256_23310 [Mucilaginibacter sp. PAMC 26640]|nr:hypothetical protein A0256_23310 [Mucilaginibacter sp. PAMC 26640]